MSDIPDPMGDAELREAKEASDRGWAVIDACSQEQLTMDFACFAAHPHNWLLFSEEERAAASIQVGLAALGGFKFNGLWRPR